MRASCSAAALHDWHGSYNRGVLPMKSIALPAFTDNPGRMLPTRDSVWPVGLRGTSGAYAAARHTDVQLAGILVTGRVNADLAGACRTARASSPDR